MNRIKVQWRILVGLFVSLGIVTLIPGKSESILGYSTLGPWVPISTVILWFLSYSFYIMGRWLTARPLRPRA